MSKMDELALEIIELQDELKTTKKNNKIANLKCNMKKIDAVLKIGFAISAVPTIGTFVALKNGWNPYKLNDIAKPSITQTYIDSEGKINEKKGYYLEKSSYIYYHTAWELTYDGNYKQIIYKYNIKNETVEKILDIIDNNVEVNESNLKELLNITKISSTTEYKEYVSENEIKKGAYIEGVISSTDNKNIIIVKESFTEHVSVFFDNIFFLLIPFIFEIVYLVGETNFFEGIYDELNIIPDIKDEEEILKRLKSKILLFKNLQMEKEDKGRCIQLSNENINIEIKNF